MSANNGSTESATKAVARNVADLASDVKTLAELQVQLLSEEFRSWSRNIIRPVLLLLVALAVMVGCVPVLLIGLAYLLAEMSGLSIAMSLLVATAAGLLVAGICAAIGWRWLRGQRNMLRLSFHEFALNISWIKHVLAHRTAAARTHSGELAQRR